MSNLFEKRRTCTRLFLMEANQFELSTGEKFSLLRILDIDRSLKCDDYHLVFENETHPILGGSNEFVNFSVYICDWSNTITITLDSIQSSTRKEDHLNRVVKSSRLKHPVTPEGILKIFKQQLAKYRHYLKGF